MKIAIFAIPLLLTIAACQNTYEGAKTDVRQKSRPFRATAADWLYPEIDHANYKPPLVVYQPPFCYKTWDKPVCTVSPQGGEDHRLVGVNQPVRVPTVEEQQGY